MRNADESNLMAGDKVLLRQLQPRANKWTAGFGNEQYALIDKCGSSVVIELRGRGNLEIQYTWICIIKEAGGQGKSMFLEEDGETDPGMEPSDKEDSRQRETIPWLPSLQDQCGQDIRQRDLRISFLIERLMFIWLKGTFSVTLGICYSTINEWGWVSYEELWRSRRVLITPSEISTILHMIREPNSIIVLLTCLPPLIYLC